MMNESASRGWLLATVGRFHVQGRLVDVLGSLYRSSEEALKELVANAWDADATRVEINLPVPLTNQPLTVRDNGCGMTPQELAARYLDVAFDRRAISETTRRGRRVRGFRGIGKFAGFVAADQMSISTVARELRSSLVLDRTIIRHHAKDLETVQVPIRTEPADGPPCTIVELTGLRKGFERPSAKKLAAILLREFGSTDDFIIVIDGARLTPDLVSAKKTQLELPLQGQAVTEVTLWLLPTERALSEPGIVVKVDERAVGPPLTFGLDEDPDIPPGTLRRLLAEVKADHLRDYVTTNWGSIVENSEAYQELKREAAAAIKKQLLTLLESEGNETEEQFIKRYAEQLELLPLPRREQARRALLRTFKRLFGESPERKQTVAELVLKIFEEDRYWLIARRLEEIDAEDLLKLADVLHDWGLGEVAEIAVRARDRLRFLDYFERLGTAASTLELQDIHPVLEVNPWLLGDEFELWVSNRTMRRIVQEFSDRVYEESNSKKRPDLIMIGLNDHRLLIELKRPSEEVSWDNIAQVKEYRDSIQPYFPNKNFSCMVIGGSARQHMAREDGLARVSTYQELVDEARTRLRWLLENIDEDAQSIGTLAQNPLL